MSLAKTSHIHEFCQPNALLTFENTVRLRIDATLEAAKPAIRAALEEVEPRLRSECEARIDRIRRGERDLYF